MKKKLRPIALILCLALVIGLMSTLAACTKSLNVTFDLNYAGASSPTVVSVKKGDAIDEPSKPLRANFDFTGWYTDKMTTDASKYAFTSLVESNLLLYAGWEAYPTITFDLNFEGAPAPSVVSVKKGESTVAPSTPSRGADYSFVGWFDQSGTFEYAFGAVTEDTIVYAKWHDISVQYIAVSFNYNYSGCPASATQEVAEGGKAVKPSNPLRGVGYSFSAWCTDASGTTTYDFNTAVVAPITLFARWSELFVFDAECTDIEDLYGPSWSGTVYGLDLINRDLPVGTIGCMNASNGAFIGFLGERGDNTTLTFEINSDRTITDAKLVLRLSAEMRDITLSSDNYKVMVNGTSITYGPFVIDEVPGGMSMIRKPFQDFTISDPITLTAGKNIIALVVNNDIELPGTTTSAIAPFVDCIKISTYAALTWSPIDNLSKLG